ncbi:MAG TPA: cell division topological specificity factor MinE [Alphaproteobacteria bacterium]|nr:cell division topological specificity factor MinE [Alphaproteobacteria bacterium]
MSIISFLLPKKQKTASVAKERLQIILAHERSRNNSAPDFLPKLQKELLEVVAKYVPIKEEQIKISLEKAQDTSILEINVELNPGSSN